MKKEGHMGIIERTERVRGMRAPRPEERRGSRARRRPPTHVPPLLGPSPRYVIKDVLHRGGMGEILLAEVMGADGFRRPVVLKGLLDRFKDDPVSKALFLREAQLMARLDHPNLVRVFDLPVLDGRRYLAMEFVHGRNLHQVIQRVCVPNQGIPQDQLRFFLHVAAEICRGLHYAHALRGEQGPLGLVHRDVSPGNVLMSFFGEVKLCDFGIARVDASPHLTAPKSIRGKARYVAPEQVKGETATLHSDVYSAGVVLAEALLGRALWDAKSVPDTLLAIVSEPREHTLDRVLQGRNVRGLRAALRGALALDPRDRFASALLLAETLESIAEDLGPRVSPVELGLFLRGAFRRDHDVPDQDGFGPSGFPPPRFEAEPATDSTVVGLEELLEPRLRGASLPVPADALGALEWDPLLDGPDTRPMAAGELAATMADALYQEVSAVATKPPTVAPMCEVPLSQPMIDRSSFGSAAKIYEGVLVTPIEAPHPPPFAETLAEARAELQARTQAPALQLRAARPDSAVVEPPRPLPPLRAPSLDRPTVPNRGDAATTAPPTPIVPESPTRRPPRPPKAQRDGPSPTEDEAQRQVTLLLVGILIGATLAITGCVVALLAGP